MLGIVAFGQTTPKWVTTDYDTQRSRAANLLKGKRFSEAKALASELNRRVPDDVEIYGILAEAQIELGEYEAAEKNVNWMFRLRPPSVESLSLGARLREKLGDVPGALEFCGTAFRMTLPADTDARERLLLLMASIESRAGMHKQAQQHLEQLKASKQNRRNP
jgi:tetratricopeptide (TPR) repeat protein